MRYRNRSRVIRPVQECFNCCACLRTLFWRWDVQPGLGKRSFRHMKSEIRTLFLRILGSHEKCSLLTQERCMTYKNIFIQTECRWTQTNRRRDSTCQLLAQAPIFLRQQTLFTTTFRTLWVTSSWKEGNHVSRCVSFWPEQCVPEINRSSSLF